MYRRGSLRDATELARENRIDVVGCRTGRRRQLRKRCHIQTHAHTRGGERTEIRQNGSCRDATQLHICNWHARSETFLYTGQTVGGRARVSTARATTRNAPPPSRKQSTEAFVFAGRGKQSTPHNRTGSGKESFSISRFFFLEFFFYV